MFSNKTYDFLKWCALIFLPALGSAYFALAGIWDLPAAEQVVGTIVVVDTFLGAILGLSNKKYNAGDDKYDGEIKVTSDSENTTVHLALDDAKNALAGNSELTFKVVRQ